MRRCRRGFTLVEVLAVISCLAVLLTLCAVLVNSLFKVERTSRLHVAEAGTFSRLTSEFRRHARDATRIDAPREHGEPSDSLAFLTPDGSVANYQAVDDGVELTVKPPEDSPDAIRHEHFVLTLYGRARFKVEQADGRTFASAEFSRPASRVRFESVPSLRIDAVVSRDHFPQPGGAKP